MGWSPFVFPPSTLHCTLLRLTSQVVSLLELRRPVDCHQSPVCQPVSQEKAGIKKLAGTRFTFCTSQRDEKELYSLSYILKLSKAIKPSSNLLASLLPTGAIRPCLLRASVTTLLVTQTASTSSPDRASVLSKANLAAAGKRPGGTRDGGRRGTRAGGRRRPRSGSKPRGIGDRGSCGSNR